MDVFPFITPFGLGSGLSRTYFYRLCLYSVFQLQDGDYHDKQVEAGASAERGRSDRAAWAENISYSKKPLPLQ
jgi:hypothetical protein